MPMTYQARSITTLYQCAFIVFMALLTSTAVLAAPSNDEWQHERREWNLALPESGQVAVNNVWGDVRVRTHLKDEVYVLANIQHHQQDPRTMDLVINNESNHELGLTAHFTDNQKTNNPADWAPRRIDLTVFVPASQALSITTTKGLAEVRGLSAPLSVRTQTGNVLLRIKNTLDLYSDYGDVQVFFLNTQWQKASRVETKASDIEVIIPKGGNTEVGIETHGQITTDFSINIQRDESESYKTASASIGKDGSKLSIKSDRGAVRLLSSVVPDASAQ